MVHSSEPPWCMKLICLVCRVGEIEDTNKIAMELFHKEVKRSSERSREDVDRSVE